MRWHVSSFAARRGERLLGGESPDAALRAR
jgi:hypothetical protein